MAGSQRRGIKDVFYETRVLMGREYTVRRFAEDVLGGTIDPVMLGYIEKGKRFPSEALVRRLASVRKEDPQDLLVLLWRDRILHAFGRELTKVMQAPKAVAGVEDADLAVMVSEAIAALPDDGSPMALAKWRAQLRRKPTRRGGKPVGTEALAAKVEATLVDKELVAIEGAKVRRTGHHFIAQNKAERQALAVEFCTLFAKGLLDKLALPEKETGSYIRNHYFNIERKRLAEFQGRLDEQLRQLAHEYSSDASAATDFLNVLVTSTLY